MGTITKNVKKLLDSNQKRYYYGKRTNHSKDFVNYHANPSSHLKYADPAPRFPTLKGEKVRSLSEKYIADYLFTHTLEYHYEKPLKLDSYTIKPDFYLPLYDVYIEFWGLLDESNTRYWNNFRWKVAKYQKHKIKFIPILNDDLPQLDNVFPLKLQQVLQTSS